MSWLGLEKPRSGGVIRTTWGRRVVEALDMLYYQSAVDYAGYIHRDLTPDKDLLYSLGRPFARIKEVHAGHGYFSYDVFIAGRRAIKDGDPVNIYDIFEPAQRKITLAIDYSMHYQVVVSVDSKLADVLQKLDVKVSVLKDQLDKVYQRLIETLNVDTLKTERTVSGLIEGITADGYQDILFPSAGKRIATRGWLIHSDSTAGIIRMFFRDSGKLVGVLFASKQGFNLNNRANITGYEDEPVRLSWSGLSVNSNLFYQITFKEE